jgi:hypothetical protein
MTRRARACRPDDDIGSVAVLFTFIVIIAGTLVTFLVDAGAQIQAANRADTYSAEAARAATIAVGPVPTGGPADTTAAATAARAYLEQAGAQGTVTVTGPATVAVRVTVTDVTPMLGISVSQTRTHTAQLLVGVTTGERIP